MWTFLQATLVSAVVIQLANNHAFDWEEEGFRKTIASLGEDAFGAGTYEEAYKVKVVEKGGMKIGFFALSFAAYKGVFDDVMNHDGLGCAYINDLQVNHVIIEAKKNVDFLFVLPHDGIEYIDIPMPETVARYRDFIDYGADGVIGTHPHCPQGWEEYKGKPIFYSLGNFLFNSKENYDYRAWNRPHWYEGMCVVMTICSGMLHWDVINTKNVDNVRIEIDTLDSRNRHNELLCDYLRNGVLYSNELNKQCKRLTGVQEMPIIDKTFHLATLKQCTRILWHKWIQRIKGTKKEDDSALKALLRNDTRRSVIMRYLQVNDTRS